jgi:cytochrome c2
MSFAGLRKIKDRANMIAFLNSISDEPLPNNGLK